MSIADAVTLRKAIDQRIETTSYANMTASEAKESKQTIFIEISQRLAFNHAVPPNRITQPSHRSTSPSIGYNKTHGIFRGKILHNVTRSNQHESEDKKNGSSLRAV